MAEKIITPMSVNAKVARTEAENAKNYVSEVIQLKAHFESIISKAIKNAKFSIDKQVWSNDRFSPEAVAKTVETLQENGYKVIQGTNNAQQQVTIDVSW